VFCVGFGGVFSWGGYLSDFLCGRVGVLSLVAFFFLFLLFCSFCWCQLFSGSRGEVVKVVVVWVFFLWGFALCCVLGYVFLIGGLKWCVLVGWGGSTEKKARCVCYRVQATP